MGEHPSLDAFADPATEDDANLGTEWLSSIDAISVGPLEWAIATAVDQRRWGRIDISPSFQRREVWTESKTSLFVDSIALQISVPPVALAEKRTERNRFFVLDGRQRLLTLRQYLAFLIDTLQTLD